LPVDYSNTILTSRLQVVANAIDAGGSNGFIRLLSGGNVVSSFQLSRPCATVSNDLLAFNGLSLIDPSAAGSGTVTAARCEDSAGNVAIFGLTVGTGSTSFDIIMTPTNNITAGQTVGLTAATITTGN
jgi:hypothetical protein